MATEPIWRQKEEGGSRCLPAGLSVGPLATLEQNYSCCFGGGGGGMTIKFPAILSHFGLLPLRAVGICLVQAKPNLLSKFSLPACQWQLCWLEPKPTMSGS